jgi:hypothetical protein
MSWKNIQAQINYSGRLFARVAVNSKDGTVLYVSGSGSLALRLAQVVRAGPHHCLVRLPGQSAEDRPLNVDHPERTAPPHVGNIVLVEAKPGGRWWPLDNKVAAVLGGFAKLGRFAGVDVFGSRRADTVWDASVCFLAGSLKSATVRLFDRSATVVHKQTVEFARPSQERLPRISPDVVGADVLLQGIDNNDPLYGALLRQPWSTISGERRREGTEVVTKSGRHFYSNDELRSGTVTRIDGQWIGIRDDAGIEVSLHRDFAPAVPFPGQRLRFFEEHRRDGRIQAIAPRVA